MIKQWYTLRGKPCKQPKLSDWLIDWDGDSLSKFQKNVKDFLRPYWEKTKIVLEESRIPGSLLSCDYLNVTDCIVIECQGLQHTSLNSFFHSSESDYRAQLKRDILKGQWCQKMGLTLVEIFPDDLDNLSPEWFKDKYSIIL